MQLSSRTTIERSVVPFQAAPALLYRGRLTLYVVRSGASIQLKDALLLLLMLSEQLEQIDYRHDRDSDELKQVGYG